jgi:thiamine-phosphate pyrophosphorylase
VIPTLHLVTDDSVLQKDGFLVKAREVMRSGGREVALHLRGPGLHGRRLFDLALALKEDARSSGTLLLVNDRIDVALALALPGVHLGQRSLPPGVARKILGEAALLGVSTHGVPEALEGEEGGADFLLVGTIFSTSSHPDVLPAGTGRVSEVAEAASLPLVGIGGITPTRVPEVLAAGAHGVAVRSAVWGREDPGLEVGVFLREIRGFRGQA